MSAKRAPSDDAELTLKIAAIVAQSTDAESLQNVLQALCEELSWDLGEVWLTVPDHGTLQLSAAWHPSPDTADHWVKMSRNVAVNPGVGMVGRVWEKGEPEWIGDIPNSDLFARAPFAADAGLTTVCAFPLRAQGRVVGVGSLFSREERARDDRMISRLVVAGVQMGAVAQAYEITHRSERYFRDLTESTNDILGVLRIDGTIEYENSAVERVLGYQALERHGRSVFDFIHPDDIPLTFDSIWAGVQEPGSVQRIEVRARHRNGHWVWLECVGSIKMEKAGPIVIVASRDITERKRLQAAQVDSETRIRKLVNTSPIILFELDCEGVYTLSEGGALEGIGRKAGEAVGKSVDLVYQDVPSVPQIIRMALSGETVSVEVPVRKRWFRASAAPIYDDSGAVVAAGGVAVDITELKAQQMFLQQLNRLLEMIALGSPRDEVLNELAATLEESIEDSACVIWTLTNGRLEPLATSGLPDTVALALAKGVMAGPGLALWRLPGTGPEDVRSADLTSDDAWGNALAPMLAAGFVQVWSSPIVGDGAAVNAGIDVYHLANVDPGPVEEEYLRGASRVARAAILRPSAGTAASGAGAPRAAATPRAGRTPVPAVSPKGRRRGKAAQHALNLSDVQARILRLIARGLSNDEIARAVSLSPHTVKDYVSMISRSLGAKNRAHAVALAIDLGLV